MRLFLTLCLCLMTTLAIAADTIYVSSLTNGTPPRLNVAKFTRAGTGPLLPAGSISLVLSKAGGVTTIQPNGTTQLHVYRTELVGTKARIVRETVDLNTFTFLPNVAGSSVATPANLSATFNVDSNDVLMLGQKVAGTVLATRRVNAAGGVFGGFRALPRFPAAPFGGRISDGKPFFFTALWIEPNSGRTGVTFANVTGPAQSKSFLFTNPIYAHDVSLSFPREDTASAKEVGDSDYYWYLIAEGVPAADAYRIATRKILRDEDDDLRAADFTPIGNVIPIAPQKRAGSIPALRFNGVAIDPLAIAIVYLRWNIPANNYDVVLQTFNPITGRKVGPPKIVLRAVRGFLNYGLSVFNANFRNGVTND